MRDYRAYPLFGRKMELVNIADEYIGRIHEVIKDIKNGEAESYACKKHDIDKNVFRRFVFAQKAGFSYEAKYPQILDKDGMPDTTSIVKMGFLSWQEKLFRDCFLSLSLYEIPPDINKSMDFVLDHAHGLLKEREVTILRLRYEQGMTYAETGKQFNVTRERIRQIEAKAMRKICGDKISRYLLYGLDYVSKIDELRNHQFESKRKTEMEKLKAHFEELSRQADEKEATDFLNEVTEYVKKNFWDKAIGDISIDAMELSVRTRNCLARGGILTLTQLRQKTVKDLMRIRHMGLKSVEEVVAKAKEYNVDIKKE